MASIRGAAFIFALFSTGQVAAQVTLVKAGRLLDPRTGSLLSPAAVLIENGRIKKVGSPAQAQADAPAGVKIIDLGRATLLPGLIDSHTHLLLDVVVPPEAEIARHLNGKFAPGMLLAIVESPTKRVLMGAHLAREDLETQPFATLVTQGSMAILSSVTPSTQAECRARESWLPDANR